jgi:hypothetical protein
VKTLDSIRALAPTALHQAQPGAYFSPILATRALRAKDAAERVSRVPRACAPIPVPVALVGSIPVV